MRRYTYVCQLSEVVQSQIETCLRLKLVELTDYEDIESVIENALDGKIVDLFNNDEYVTLEQFQSWELNRLHGSPSRF